MNKPFFFLLLAFPTLLTAQNFTRKDSLQGGLRPERTSYDVQRYDLDITVDPDKKSVIGYNDITFKVIENTSRIQVDLFANMNVDSIVHEKKRLGYTRDFNAVFIDFPTVLSKGSQTKIRFYYSGQPTVARNAPWDGGFVWRTDTTGKPWIGVAVQGTGASLWYPVKDSQSDEPDKGASVKVAVPNGLMDVSNGRFLGSQDLGNGYTRWDWEVKSPINTYDITVNIADYAHIHDNHNGLDLDYYVLRYNEEKARKHFAEVKTMMDCFESKFGKYPFSDDGYKLVETPYLGMEHQSAVAYGNQYLKGYRGNDLSGTGIGLTFDYITIHESGHEWFGNSITSKDIADMWIHEGFTMYSEAVYVECTLGYEKAVQYMDGLKRMIQNDVPIIGPFGVNREGSGDMYPKGAWLLQTLRHVLDDDAKWWAALLKYSETYRHKIIDTQTVLDFYNRETGLKLDAIFDQYLRTTKIPLLRFEARKDGVAYWWENVVAGFAMPIDIFVSGKKMRIEPTTDRKTLPKNVKIGQIKVPVEKYLVKTSGI